MSRPRFVTAGEAMVRLSPPDGRMARDASSFDVFVGGTELNVAIAAAQLGVDVTWVTALPKGPFAERIVDHARRFGVEPVVCPSSARVGTYVVELGAEPRGSEVFYDRVGSAFQVAPTETAVHEQLSKPVDAVLASGISMALGSEPVRSVRALLDRAHGAVRFFEINHRAKLWSADEARVAVEGVLGDVDVLVASSYDLTGLLALDEDPIVAARRAGDRWSIERIVITERSGGVGEAGMNRVVVVGADGVEATAEAAGRVLDPVGAGDAATGAFISTWLLSGSVELAARSSVRAAALKQTIPGDAVMLRADDLDESGPRIRR